MFNEGFGSRLDACSLQMREREVCNRVACDLSFVDLVLEIRKGKREFVKREELRELQCVCVIVCVCMCVCWCAYACVYLCVSDLYATRWPNAALVRCSGRYSKK